MKRDDRYKGRAPLPPKGGPMKDKRKEQSKNASRGAALRRFRKSEES